MNDLSESTITMLKVPARRAVWGYAAGLAPVILVWMLLVGWLAATLYDRAAWAEAADRATIREWLDEARNFRKSLPELVREYARLKAADPAGDRDPITLQTKRDEIAEHMRSLAEPTRTYQNQLPSFPEIYRVEVLYRGAGPPDVIAWETTVPRPKRESAAVRTVRYRPLPDDPAAEIVCDFKLHAFNRLAQGESEKRRTALAAGALLVAATALAVAGFRRFFRRERHREMERLTALAEVEHRERELLEARLLQRDALEAKQAADAALLRQQLDAADFQRRAAAAENAALELKSQLYAGIGIMAGSYAHNIKNLLVRPNDLLARCIEVNGLSPTQEGMLSEVRDTLGTVTERLQQILKTVRRDPTEAEMAPLDLNRLLSDSVTTWADTARDKWKLDLAADLCAGPLPVRGDASHLVQAFENLLFNARDATFEMRNKLRDDARAAPADGRKDKLLAAAAWRGAVRITTRRTAGGVELAVTDNGIGMTDEVRANCLTTHFTTKRDNALYEGYSAGMGLGLSFVAVVLSHHGAELGIESSPGRGATFRVTFPAAADV